MNKKNKKIKDYENSDNRFKAYISLGPNMRTTMEFKVIKDNPYYDDVEDAGYSKMDELYPEDSYPKAEIERYEIFCSETGEWCSVVRESDEKRIRMLKKHSKASRYLVLPEYTYHITPECKLWMTLKENGVIGEEEDFDFEKMRKILKSIKNM